MSFPDLGIPPYIIQYRQAKMGRNLTDFLHIDHRPFPHVDFDVPTANVVSLAVNDLYEFPTRAPSGANSYLLDGFHKSHRNVDDCRGLIRICFQCHTIR